MKLFPYFQTSCQVINEFLTRFLDHIRRTQGPCCVFVGIENRICCKSSENKEEVGIYFTISDTESSSVILTLNGNEGQQKYTAMSRG